MCGFFYGFISLIELFRYDRYWVCWSELIRNSRTTSRFIWFYVPPIVSQKTLSGNCERKAESWKEAEKNKEAARVWISGLEAVNRHLGVARVIDLSATPFFLSGSGYAEGTLFPWTMSDFSLMDAIECGIVKLDRKSVV